MNNLKGNEIKTIFRSRRGSVTVFVMMFMVSLIMLFMVMIRAAKDTAVKGAFSSLGPMWCDSILAEYDQNLQDRYDIFAFYGLAPEVSAKLRFYAGESILDKKYVTMSRAEGSLAGYSLIDTDNFRRQVTRVAKYRIAGDIKGEANEYVFHGAPQPKAGGSALMTDLPSGGTRKSVSASTFRHAVEAAGSLKSAVSKAGDAFLEDKYIFSYFKDKSDDKDLGETYLSNEIEYLVCGAKSDREIEDNIKMRIIAIRTIFNTIYAFEDPEISAETLAAAEIITPGPASLATQKILQTGWAACESVNDYNLLIKGKKVPFYKDSSSWALSLESVIKGGIKELDEGASPEMKDEVPCIDPGSEHGETYQDYLRTMLFLMDEDVKLLRMMDLIQMNMRLCHYSDFRIREYNTGLKASFEMNGGKLDVERAYFGFRKDNA